MRAQFNKLALALTAAGLVTVLAGCGGGSGSSSASVLPPPAPSAAGATSYQIRFVDAVTGDPVPLTNALTVGFGGASITDLEVRQSSKDSNGQYPTITTSTSIPSKGEPITVLAFFNGTDDGFKVSVKGAGWLDASAEIVPKISTETQTVTVRLSKAAVSTSDYVAAAKTAQASNGQVTTTVTVATSTAQSETAAQIQIPSNTTATRADGTTSVATGALTVSVVRSIVSTNSVPLETNARGESFSLGDPIGVARFSVTDSAGAAVTQFSPPIKLSINLAAGAQFPGTTKALTGGETNYPVSYFDEITKQWVPHDKLGTVTKNANGTFTVTFESNHLSLWTLNPSYNPANSCIFSTLNLTGRPTGDATPLTLTLTGSTPGSTFSKTIGPVADNSLSLLYAPLEPVNIAVTSPAGVAIGPNPVNLCEITPPNTTAIHSLNLSGLTPPTPATLTVNVTETCSNDSTVSRVLPTSVYYQYKLSSGLYTSLGGWTGDDGSITIGSVPLNTSGELKIWNPYLSTGAGYVYPQDPAGSGSYTINEEVKTLSYDIPVTCQIVTGSTQP